MNILHFFRHWPLQRKLLSLIMAAAILPASILGWFEYQRLATEIKKNIHTASALEVERSANAIQSFLSPVNKDLAFLSRSESLRYLLDPSSTHHGKSTMQEALHSFQSIMQSKSAYMQLRGIAMNGQEIVRIERSQINGPLRIVRGSALQDKHNASYVNHTLELKNNMNYVSPMNLNREHGEIQEPHVPVIRFTRLIQNSQGERIGMVIINVFAQPILDLLALNIDTDNETTDAFFLLNSNGFYLYHHNPSLRFGFDLGNSNTIIEKEPALWDQVQEHDEGFSLLDENLYYFRKIQTIQQHDSRNWFLVHKVSQSEAFAEIDDYERTLGIAILCMLLIMTWLSRSFVASIITPIQGITRKMQQLAKGEADDTPMHYRSDDEISRMLAASAQVQKVQDDISIVAEKMSRGNFSSDFKAQSDQDKMGLSLQRMLLRMRETAVVTQALAEGELSREFTIEGLDDQLGHALQQLVNTMQQASEHAIEISQGDFRRDYEPRSEHDTLGVALQEMIRRLREASQAAAAIATGEFDREVACHGEFDQLGRSLQHMMGALAKAEEQHKQQDWLKSGLASITATMQGQTSMELLAEVILSQLAPMLNILHATFYIWNNESGCLQLKGRYACSDAALTSLLQAGSGLTGQCALDKKIRVITDIPADYIQIQSSMGSSTPRTVIEIPLLADGDLTGVIELAGYSPLSTIQMTMLEQLSPLLGTAVYVLKQNRQTEKLLEESQALTEELQAQEEELREANSTLEIRAEELSASEEELQAQQEELRLNNDELIAKNKTVEAQKDSLKASAESLTLQAQQLQEASQYKSDFLSNMSHELRTPLNSLLILSDMLAKNKEQNLTEKQVKFAETIHGSGIDLLQLINDILDLAKVEAGKMILDPHRFPLQDIVDSMQRDFTHVAEQKAIGFRLESSADVPEMLFSDAIRIKQVLKNLLSNAFKFTEMGDVILHMNQVDTHQVSFSVSDSGVGIAADKLHDIFEAFQQEDGSTSRKYGGTGLGLSICREMAKLLGGHITVQSEQGKGSRFALIIPIECDSTSTDAGDGIFKAAPESSPPTFSKPASALNPTRSTPVTQTLASNNVEPEDIAPPVLPNPMDDDRNDIQANDYTILIVEDDENFAAIQQSLVQEHGFKALNALRGDHGLMLAQQYIPDAILLDLQLPVLDGMSLLDRLKQHPALRHIPVRVISCMDKSTEKKVLHAGALSFIHKPAKKEELDNVLDEIEEFLQRDIKRLLIVEDNENQAEAMFHLLNTNDVEILTTATGEATLNLLRNQHIDCMILDLTLPDMSGEAILETIQQEDGLINQGHVLPIIVHTGKDLSEDEVEKLQSMSKSIIVKGSYSPDRLLAETSLFLHQLEENMSNDKQQRIGNVREEDVDLNGKTVLLVDDDIRNIYSLSSYLEGHGMTIHTARNGLESLDVLNEHAATVDLVLMDIMMPEMDGYEATMAIREINAHKNLPIIALTAKAMKGDREQCIAAGASDYITKPVDTDKLISLMRVWLHE